MVAVIKEGLYEVTTGTPTPHVLHWSSHCVETLSEHKQTTSHCTQPGLLHTAVQRVYGDNDEAVGMYDQHTIQCSYNRKEWFSSLTSSGLISGVEMYTLG